MKFKGFGKVSTNSMKTSSNNSKRKKILSKAKKEGRKIIHQNIVNNLFLTDLSEKEIEQEREEYTRNHKLMTDKGLAEILAISGDIIPEDERCLHLKNFLRLEAAKRNLYTEIAGLCQLENLGSFSQARKVLFLAVGEAIEHGSNYPESVKEKIRKAGEMLNESGGFIDMSDYLVWSFIPKSLHREIELHWDGIGDWKG